MENKQKQNIQKSKKKAAVVNVFLFLLLAVMFIASLCMGKYPVSPLDSLRILIGKGYLSDPMAVNVVNGLRLPRLLASVICGAALSLSGAVYQASFQNQLVSPDFLGVSQGACVGAAVAILGGMDGAATQLLAFFGGLAAVLLTLIIPFLMRSKSNIILVLSGIIVGGVMSSVLGFLKYIADPTTQLASITYWQMGSFSYVTMESLLKILPLTVIPAVLLILLSWRIDIISLGESEATILGTNIRMIRTLAIISATFLTASAVCLAGTIGWVGLVIPQFGRMTVGSSNTRLFPASCIIGALFMLFVDTATRLMGPAEMPISILTGIIGAPFYAWMLYKRRGSVQ